MKLFNFIKDLNQYYKNAGIIQPVKSVELKDDRILIILDKSCVLGAEFNKLISVFNNYLVDIKPAYKGSKIKLYHISIFNN